jgi:peptidoglycan/xylan/chitin deacetylase (PgdA/CDA1 family)
MSPTAGRCLVLVYHAIGEVKRGRDPRRLAAPLSVLESHVAWLGRRGYRFLSVDQLADGVDQAKSVALTFDDGFADALTLTAPALERLGVPGSFFVAPGLCGCQHPDVSGPEGRLMTTDEVCRLHRLGFTIGAHSLSHPDLRVLDDPALQEEVAGSKRAVESLTGDRCRSFAYPYGVYDARVKRTVEDAGFDLAFTWSPGRWDPFAAPRLPAPVRDGGVRLQLKLAASLRARRCFPAF